MGLDSLRRLGSREKHTQGLWGQLRLYWRHAGKAHGPDRCPTPEMGTFTALPLSMLAPPHPTCPQPCGNSGPKLCGAGVAAVTTRSEVWGWLGRAGSAAPGPHCALFCRDGSLAPSCPLLSPPGASELPVTPSFHIPLYRESEQQVGMERGPCGTVTG